MVVLRLGYFDGTGLWRPDKVAACSLPLCRWPITELGVQVARLAQYYGDCLVAPEANFDSGLIRDLRAAGVHVYEREKPPTDKEAGAKTGKFGFRTRGEEGEGTRRAILEDSAHAIRHWNKEGQGVEMSSVELVEQHQNFIIKDGKEQALEGKLDDGVMALAIARAVKAGATRYVERRYHQELPPEVARYERQRQRAAGSARTHRR